MLYSQVARSKGKQYYKDMIRVNAVNNVNLQFSLNQEGEVKIDGQSGYLTMCAQTGVFQLDL